jgi:hypothetical protein
MFKEGRNKMLAINIPTLHLERKNCIHHHNTFIIELFDVLSNNESIVGKTLNDIEETIDDKDEMPAYMNKMHLL